MHSYFCSHRHFYIFHFHLGRVFFYLNLHNFTLFDSSVMSMTRVRQSNILASVVKRCLSIYLIDLLVTSVNILSRQRRSVPAGKSNNKREQNFIIVIGSHERAPHDPPSSRKMFPLAVMLCQLDS